MNKLLTVATLTAAFLLAACGPRSDSGENLAITEHRFDAAAPKRLLVAGDDCTSGGPDQCATSLCLHVSPDPSSGYVCSMACSTNADCPVAWRCVQFYPSADGRACVPAPKN